jgi:hypothetical protein
MPTDSYIIVAMAFVTVGSLVGMGLFVSTHKIKQFTNGTPISLVESKVTKVSESSRHELSDCLDLADFVARDADVLASLLAQPARLASNELDCTLQQILKTMRHVAGRLERIGKNEAIAASDTPPKPLTLPNREFALEAKEPAAIAVASTADETSKERGTDDASHETNRKHPRKLCPGSFKATIYPPPFNPGGEPVQCTLRTRDLSCGGIGIAHVEQLYPQQIIVLNAVTKLLIGEVRWCRQIGERSYIAGCQLVKASGGKE